MGAKCSKMEQKAETMFLQKLFDDFLGASWAPSREPEKATRGQRRAFGTGMEAKCRNMEQKVENIDFTKVFFDDFVGELG